MFWRKRRVGNSLLHFKGELQVATTELIKMTGYEAELLESGDIVPQPFRDSYQLVVSNPSIIAIDAFVGIGVPVYQAEAESIKMAWEQYKSNQIPEFDAEVLFDEYRRYTAELL